MQMRVAINGDLQPEKCGESSLNLSFAASASSWICLVSRTISRRIDNETACISFIRACRMSSHRYGDGPTERSRSNRATQSGTSTGGIGDANASP